MDCAYNAFDVILPMNSYGFVAANCSTTQGEIFCSGQALFHGNDLFIRDCNIQFER